MLWGYNETDLKWFAIRVTYSREMALKGYLDQYGIESFIPMHYKEFIKGERKVRKLVPCHSQSGIRAVESREDGRNQERRFRSRFLLRYIMDRERREPLVVPDRQMSSFHSRGRGLRRAGGLSRLSRLLSLREGDRVRITGGVFAGVEGVFLRVKGDRRVVVSIEGVMAVATAFVHPSSDRAGLHDRFSG